MNEWNNYGAKNKNDLDILKYPTKAELYPGEIRDVIFDVLFSKTDNAKNDYWSMLKIFNDYRGIQKAKKEDIKNKINGYRNISNIKDFLAKYGFYLKSSSNHYVFAYYNQDRYQITAACTPSDGNAGKNLAEELIDLCL